MHNDTLAETVINVNNRTVELYLWALDLWRIVNSQKNGASVANYI
jgi:hypothetical protein